MAAGFWNSDLIKGIEKGKLPTVETDISFDVETIATIITIVVIAIIIVILVYKKVLK